MPPIERPAARTDNVDRAEPPPIPLPVLLEQQRAYCDQRTREIEIEMGLRPTVHISEADTPDRSGE